MSKRARESRTKKRKKPDHVVNYDKEINPFNNLINSLKENGYTVEEAEFGFPDSIKVTGKNIFGGFCNYGEETYPHLSGRFCADHSKCFDKWSKTPLQLLIPDNKKKLKFLLEKLETLGTKEGYEKSNSFDRSFYIEDPFAD